VRAWIETIYIVITTDNHWVARHVRAWIETW